MENKLLRDRTNDSTDYVIPIRTQGDLVQVADCTVRNKQLSVVRDRLMPRAKLQELIEQDVLTEANTLSDEQMERIEHYCSQGYPWDDSDPLAKLIRSGEHVLDWRNYDEYMNQVEEAELREQRGQQI